ncbi:hypothetical protein [Novosphingobium aromaticivorans]|uniref:hypothetical protein n=1 Tax=Novosphingobium aromaticivorans TaxID=48935 RepID=UPI0005A13D6B|nr:hypothetical protein [Novosphingobium aromaticivorans]
MAFGTSFARPNIGARLQDIVRCGKHAESNRPRAAASKPNSTGSRCGRCGESSGAALRGNRFPRTIRTTIVQPDGETVTGLQQGMKMQCNWAAFHAAAIVPIFSGT